MGRRGRRVKERPILFAGLMVRAILAGRKTQTRRVVNPNRAHPYHVGDTLWVRESWAIGMVEGSRAYIARAERMPAGKTLADTDGGLDEVGDLTPEQSRWAEDRIGTERWRPSIFMPRWASRITLRVTAVRCERLQDISEDDAKAEGVTTEPRPGKVNGQPSTLCPMTHRMAFVWGWDTINGKRAPWARNPWVWAITFGRVE